MGHLKFRASSSSRSKSDRSNLFRCTEGLIYLPRAIIFLRAGIRFFCSRPFSRVDEGDKIEFLPAPMIYAAFWACLAGCQPGPMAVTSGVYVFKAMTTLILLLFLSFSISCPSADANPRWLFAFFSSGIREESKSRPGKKEKEKLGAPRNRKFSSLNRPFLSNRAGRRRQQSFFKRQDLQVCKVHQRLPRFVTKNIFIVKWAL